MENKSGKLKGIYTFDLLFAILIVLLMFYFATIVITEFRDEIYSMSKEFNGKTKSFLISEKLIIKDLAFLDTQTYPNYIDSAKLSSNQINSTKYINDFRISSINISLSSSNSVIFVSEGNFSKTDTFCYTRLVLVRNLLIDNPGILRVCIQNK